jgi:uncharacterized protein with LGFP repeats
MLLQGEEGAPDNYRLSFSPGAQEGYQDSTRHRHNFEQLRHPLDGGYSIAKDTVIPAGWVGYFPESTFYGPQHRSAMVMTLGLQFGGPSGIGFTTARQRQHAREQLLAKAGVFDKGVYTWHDESGKRHNQDAYDAVWEQIYGKKVVYPEPRYDSFILMNPLAFPWVSDDSSPGVSHKWLGTYSERQIRVGFIHLDVGSSMCFGTECSNEIMFLEQGSLSHAGQTHDRYSAYGSSASDQPELLTAQQDSLLYYVKLPTF